MMTEKHSWHSQRCYWSIDSFNFLEPFPSLERHISTVLRTVTEQHFFPLVALLFNYLTSIMFPVLTKTAPRRQMLYHPIWSSPHKPVSNCWRLPLQTVKFRRRHISRRYSLLRRRKLWMNDSNIPWMNSSHTNCPLSSFCRTCDVFPSSITRARSSA